MSLRDRILGLKGKHREVTEQTIVDWHDYLMAEYGWIPLEEFRNLPIPTTLNLLGCIRRRREAEERSMKKRR